MTCFQMARKRCIATQFRQTWKKENENLHQKVRKSPLYLEKKHFYEIPYLLEFWIIDSYEYLATIYSISYYVCFV